MSTFNLLKFMIAKYNQRDRTAEGDVISMAMRMARDPPKGMKSVARIISLGEKTGDRNFNWNSGKELPSLQGDILLLRKISDKLQDRVYIYGSYGEVIISEIALKWMLKRTDDIFDPSFIVHHDYPKICCLMTALNKINTCDDE